MYVETRVEGKSQQDPLIPCGDPHTSGRVQAPRKDGRRNAPTATLLVVAKRLEGGDVSRRMC